MWMYIVSDEKKTLPICLALNKKWTVRRCLWICTLQLWLIRTDEPSVFFFNLSVLLRKKKYWFLSAAGGLRNMFTFLAREVQEQVVIHVKCWRMCTRTRKRFPPPKSAGDIFLFSVWHFNTGSTSYIGGKEKSRTHVATNERNVACSFLLILVGNHICWLNHIWNKLSVFVLSSMQMTHKGAVSGKQGSLAPPTAFSP